MLILAIVGWFVALCGVAFLWRSYVPARARNTFEYDQLVMGLFEADLFYPGLVMLIVGLLVAWIFK